ncbi:MAG: peptidase U32 family protein [Candidatus Zapsychrus exili]|nr:peptidase U32 family protein [Candidatus Zapsychrus exili]
MKKHKPELLSPAGDWPSLLSAIEGGADSVYFGVKGINMRHMASNFDILEISKVMDLLHKNKRRGYLTLNTTISNKELAKVSKILKEAKKSSVDAVVLWDMAVLLKARELGLNIHISTQANVSNVDALKTYASLGAKRIVLARECHLVDIRKIIKVIKEEKIDCEVESFIHGAMCVSISGRCFMSYYSHGKSANQGKCIQPCRREFLIKDLDDESSFVIGKDYVLSPKDLCTIDFIDELMDAGIHSFKIEGRMRSPEYIKEVTSCYRKAIDCHLKGKLTKQLKKKLKERVSQVYNRGFSTGFYFGKPEESNSNRLEHSYEKIYVGDVTRFFKKISVAEVRVRTKEIKVGDDILFLGKSTPSEKHKVAEMRIDDKSVKKAKKGDFVGIKLPFFAKPQDKVFLWKRKHKL